MATLIRQRNGPRPSPEAMTLGEHLGELRRRLIVCLVIFVAGCIVVYVGYDHLITIMRHPYCQALHVKANSIRCQFIILNPLDGFGIRLNVSAYGGVVIGSPVILYQLWRFVTPGLKANEKRYAVPFAMATVGLFVFGAFIAWITYPHALGFLLGQSGTGVRPELTPQKYLSLILTLMAIFGIAFEFPVVLVALELAGAVSPQQLRKWRRIAIMIIVVFSAVITPSSDPFSMLALAIPMLVFYEVAIAIGRMFKRHRSAIA